jgi:hypothetical protein
LQTRRARTTSTGGKRGRRTGMHDEILASFRPLPFELCVCIGMRVSEFLKGVRCPPPKRTHNAPVNHPGARQKAEFSGKKSVTATTYYGCKGLEIRLG